MPQSNTLPAMTPRTYSVVIGTDQHGNFPLVLRPDGSLPGGAVRWRMVTEADDFDLAMRVLEIVHRRFGNLGLV